MRARPGQRLGQPFDQKCTMHFGSVGFVHRNPIYYTLDFNFLTEIIMRLNLILTFVIGAVLTAAGCSGSTTPTGGTNVNVNAANSSAAENGNTTVANSELGTTKKPEAATTNNAPTIAPVVQT